MHCIRFSYCGNGLHLPGYAASPLLGMRDKRPLAPYFVTPAKAGVSPVAVDGAPLPLVIPTPSLCHPGPLLVTPDGAERRSGVQAGAVPAEGYRHFWVPDQVRDDKLGGPDDKWGGRGDSLREQGASIPSPWMGRRAEEAPRPDRCHATCETGHSAGCLECPVAVLEVLHLSQVPLVRGLNCDDSASLP